MPINSNLEEAGLGFANVDLQRLARQGVPEVVYGAGKTATQIVEILKALRDAGQSPVLVTRLDAEKAAVARLLEDDDRLYLVKVWAIDHTLYTPLETPPALYAEKLLLLGGWSMGHPAIEAVLDDWQLENPFRDLVNREDVYLIDSDIRHTIAYLRESYYPKASAEQIQPLSKETGLKIYRIKG